MCRRATGTATVRWHDRSPDRGAYEAAPGNYIAFSSFDYLERVVGELCKRHSGIRHGSKADAWMKANAKPGAVRRRWLWGGLRRAGQFVCRGIDLTGTRLIGASWRRWGCRS
jgi:hypothetical protein